MMVYITQSDYLNESKKNKLVLPRRGSHGGIKTSKQVRLPTQYKSKKVYCRNCAKQNTESAKTCVQCEVTIRIPKLRKRPR